MPYLPYYVGGWDNRPLTDTPITAAALDHMDAGIAAAQAAAETVAGQLSSYGPGGTAGNIGTTQGDLRYVSGRACSLTGVSGLPAPTGVGMEFVIGTDGLDDIRFNGTSL